MTELEQLNDVNVSQTHIIKQEFVKNDAQRPKVGTKGIFLTTKHFWCDVICRSYWILGDKRTFGGYENVVCKTWWCRKISRTDVEYFR
jgi:hypothetical protein